MNVEKKQKKNKETFADLQQRLESYLLRILQKMFFILWKKTQMMPQELRNIARFKITTKHSKKCRCLAAQIVESKYAFQTHHHVSSSEVRLQKYSHTVTFYRISFHKRPKF